MKRVFLSSVSEGLETYREAACQAIEGLDGYHCVRMENFGARSGSPSEYCEDAVRSSDAFVGLVGQRYGNSPPGCDESFTELEYDAAIKAGIPRLMFFAPAEFPVPANLIESDQKRERLRTFRNRVMVADVAGAFSSESGLASEVIKALHNQRDRFFPQEAPRDHTAQTHLLFPWVTAGRGYDTGLAISHTGEDPLGTVASPGTCTIRYYGVSQTSSMLAPQTSSVIRPGEVLTYVLSSGSAQYLLDNRAGGFSGYIIVECDFPHAYGFAHIGGLGQGPSGAGPSSCYLAIRIRAGRKGE